MQEKDFGYDAQLERIVNLKLKLGTLRDERGIGSTLIKLIGLVAAIGIIAGFLLPALSRANDKTVRPSYLGNQRQVALTCTLAPNDLTRNWRWLRILEE